MKILLGEIEACPTAKDMWDKLKVRFSQTSATRLCTLHLKWMQYEMDSTRTIAEHLQTMSAMVHDLKAAEREISKEESVLNVIRALPIQPDHWKNVKLAMTHSEHIRPLQRSKPTSKWRKSA